jgi:hypothetical protein
MMGGMQGLYFITLNRAGKRSEENRLCLKAHCGCVIRLELFELGHIQHKDGGTGLIRSV